MAPVEACVGKSLHKTGVFRWLLRPRRGEGLAAERVNAEWAVRRPWRKSRQEVLTGAWATQWQWGWKERINTGGGLEEDSGNGCPHLLVPACLSKRDVIRSPPAFPAPGQRPLL